MTAVLFRHFGLQHIEIAEDIVSETFLKAAETWNTGGVPENPSAWLYTVAKNKAKDYLKRHHLFETKIRHAVAPDETQAAQEFDFSQQTIADSQLAMIFAVCNPANSTEAQICLALQILCGFSVEEMADAFLAKTETVKKRLQRARATLREDNFRIQQPDAATIQSRLDTVLRTLYLLFNEGYYSQSGNHLIRKDLCSEAMRLALILTENPLTATTQAHALLALMCFQSSRFEARSSATGDTILFEQQDQELWNKELIARGNYYLVQACSGDTLSKYQLEAGIAWWHTVPSDPQKWEHILQLYNELILIEYSPMTALNRTFAYARVYGNRAGIEEATQLQLEGNSYYHALLGYLYAATDVPAAVAHYTKAIRLTKSAAEKKTLSGEISRLQGLQH
ncbi:sigma-70 family RNA polymerase sigma factor [Chitinophaga sp. Mgbs1]|uniref:Sigma-70 family RNA polymerase sigma factor n=1 Tax=Chitinophaga solisilvae TaxID=1233460 RepID=A0A433WBR1_9BACT|nr:sigma-70 family RNA polymerase sigma factor [Chitinophaga solisilvae]